MTAGSSDIEPDRRAAGYFAAALLVAAMIAGIVAVIVSGGDSSGPSSGGAFGTHYQGLEQRRLAAEVPTMAEGGGEHFHAQLRVYERGKAITVPANIGIDPANPPDVMAGLHTHDASGTIHNEAGTGATLSDFFSIWGVPLSAKRLGPFEATPTNRIGIWVDGRASRALADPKLEDGQTIVVAYGQPPASALSD